MNEQNKDRSETEMEALIQSNPKTLDCIVKMRQAAQKAIKEKGLTEKEVRRTLGIKRYEK